MHLVATPGQVNIEIAFFDKHDAEAIIIAGTQLRPCKVEGPVFYFIKIGAEEIIAYYFIGCADPGQMLTDRHTLPFDNNPNKVIPVNVCFEKLLIFYFSRSSANKTTLLQRK